MQWTRIDRSAALLSTIVAILIVIGGCIEPIPSEPFCGDGTCQSDESCLADCGSDVSDSQVVELGAASGLSLVSDPFASEGETAYVSSLTGSYDTGLSRNSGYVYVRLMGPSPSEDAVYVTIGSEQVRVYPVHTGVYEWVRVASNATGPISIEGAELNARIDVLVLSGSTMSDTELNALLTIVTSDPGSICGDGFCDANESATSCSVDCALEPVSTRTELSLRGDPSFDVSQLSSEQRIWYDRMWAAVNNPNRYPSDSHFERASSYDIGRGINMYHSSLLLGLRSTGDLNFLDEIDSGMQVLRSELRDEWCANSYDATKYNSVNPDGYLGFMYLSGSDGDLYYCRDYHKLEAALTHGHIAQVAYAYERNRDLESPAGIDYGERADFWMHYLRDHWEAKWRERYDTPWPEFPFFERHFVHTYSSIAQYHYYVGRTLELRGDPDASYYLDEASNMAWRMFNEPYVASGSGDQGGGFQVVDTAEGEAIIAAFGMVDNYGTTSLQAAPTTYWRYAVNRHVDFHLEGFEGFADDRFMERLATGISHFIYDTDPPTTEEPFARDVVGGRDDQMIPHTTYRGRETTGKIALGHLFDTIPWDPTGRIEPITLEAYDIEYDVDQPRSPNIPSAMLFTSVYEGR